MTKYLKSFMLIFSLFLTSIAFAIPISIEKNEQGQYFLENGQQIYTQSEVDITVQTEIEKFKQCLKHEKCTLDVDTSSDTSTSIINFFKSEVFLHYLFITLKVIAGISIVAGLIYTISPLKVYFLKLMIHLDFLFQKFRNFISQFFKLGLVRKLINAVTQGFLFVVRQLRKIPTKIYLAILTTISFVLMSNPKWFSFAGFGNDDAMFITSIFFTVGSLLLIATINSFEYANEQKTQQSGNKAVPSKFNPYILYNGFAFALISVISFFAFADLSQIVQMNIAISTALIAIGLMLNSFEPFTEKAMDFYLMIQFIGFTIIELIFVPMFFPEVVRLVLVFQLLIALIATIGFIIYILPFSSKMIFSNRKFKKQNLLAVIISIGLIVMIGFETAVIPAALMILGWIVFFFIRFFMLLTGIHVAFAFIMSGGLLYWITTYVEANGSQIWIYIKQMFEAFI